MAEEEDYSSNPFNSICTNEYVREDARGGITSVKTEQADVLF